METNFMTLCACNEYMFTTCWRRVRIVYRHIPGIQGVDDFTYIVSIHRIAIIHSMQLLIPGSYICACVSVWSVLG